MWNSPSTFYSFISWAFGVLMIMSNATVNICVHIFVWIYAFISLEYMHLGNVNILVWLELRVEFHSYYYSVSSFEDLLDCFPNYLHFTFPPLMCEDSNFSTYSPTVVIASLFLIAILTGVKRYLIVGFFFFFFLVFPWWLTTLIYFHVFIGRLCNNLEKCLFRLLPIFKLGFFIVEL